MRSDSLRDAPLASAREKAAQARSLLAQGWNPLDAKAQAQALAPPCPLSEPLLTNCSTALKEADAIRSTAPSGAKAVGRACRGDQRVRLTRAMGRPFRSARCNRNHNVTTDRATARTMCRRGPGRGVGDSPAALSRLGRGQTRGRRCSLGRPRGVSTSGPATKGSGLSVPRRGQKPRSRGQRPHAPGVRSGGSSSCGDSGSIPL